MPKLWPYRLSYRLYGLVRIFRDICADCAHDAHVRRYYLLYVQINCMYVSIIRTKEALST